VGGGGWSLVVLTVQAVSTTLVFVLSTWRGVGGVSPAELALLGVAGLGVAGWAVSSQPVVATVCVLVADAVGVVLMLPKTWRDPWSETASTFALAAGSGVLGHHRRRCGHGRPAAVPGLLRAGECSHGGGDPRAAQVAGGRGDPPWPLRR